MPERGISFNYAAPNTFITEVYEVNKVGEVLIENEVDNLPEMWMSVSDENG